MTSVFSCLSLTTTPCKIRFGMGLVLGLRRSALLRGDGHDAGDITAHDTHPRSVLQLPARLLKAQVELLLLKLERLVIELILGHDANVGKTAGVFHGSNVSYSTMR